jgi:hypothetical protein
MIKPVRYAIALRTLQFMFLLAAIISDKNKLIIRAPRTNLIIKLVRYDGLLDLSKSKDYYRLTHPTFYY